MPTARMTVPRSSGNELILEGYLRHVMESKAAERWVVLEKNPELGHIHLNIYRKPVGAIFKRDDLKKQYKLTRTNFIGTERGTIKDGGKRSVLYWAIILKSETILFKDSEEANKTRSEFEKWNEIVKKLWHHQSWEVSPVQGEAISEHSKLILHLNSASLCLALMSPPRHYLRWPLSSVSQCQCQDYLFSFHITGPDRPGFYEVKVTRSRYASKIKTVCDELQQTSNVICKLAPKPQPPTRQPSVEPRTPVEQPIRDMNGMLPVVKVTSEHRHSNTSTNSDHSFTRERDALSVTSLDSVLSTPPLDPQKFETENIEHTPPQNPFVFPFVLPGYSHDSHPLPPPPPPRTINSPSTPLPTEQSPAIDILSHTTSAHVSPASSHEYNTPICIPARVRAEHGRPYDEGFCEDGDHDPGTSAPRASANRQKGEEATYMNTIDGTVKVDHSTEPKEPNTYMNDDGNSPYCNPLCRPEDFRDQVPERPPKPLPPQRPQRNKKYKVYEIVERVKAGKPLEIQLITSMNALKNFCLRFDIKKDSYPLKDWRALAERVGMKTSDIELVDHNSRMVGAVTATEIVLAYWQCNAPDDKPFSLDQLVLELDSFDRQDLIAIIQQVQEDQRQRPQMR